MMTCKEYIFRLTSGQFETAGGFEKMRAFQHRLICRRCREFTRNDEKLDEILAAYKSHLEDLGNKSDGNS